MRNTWRRSAAIALTATAAIVLSACSGGVEGGGEVPSGDQVLRIGFITPLTGPSASTGIDARNGAEVAVARWNEEQLLPGYTIELVVEDDGGTPETGALSYQKLRDQGITIFTGSMNSSVAIAIANAAAGDPDVLYFITGAQTQVPLDEQSGNLVFGLQTTNATFADANLGWIAQEAKPQKVALLVENSDFGVAEKEQVESHWSSGTPEIVLTETFDRTLTDFSSILSKVRDSGADGVYVGAAGVTFAAAIFTQADAIGLDVQKFMNAGLMSQALIDAGGDAIDGIASADSYHNAVDTAESKTFVEAFQKAHNGARPSGHNELGYDSINLILGAINEVGSADSAQDIADALRAGSWTTASGPTTFNNTGRAIRPTFIIGVKDGELVLLDTVPAAG